MAGQNNLELTANLNPAGVEAGAARGKTALESVKTAAGPQGAAGGFADLEKKAGDAVTKIKGLGDEGKLSLEQLRASAATSGDAAQKLVQAFDALAVAEKKLDGASLGKMGPAAAAVQIRLEQLRAAEEAARAAGVKIGDDVGAAFTRLEPKIAQAAITTGKYKDAVGDLAVRGKAAAQGMETAAASFSSAGGVLSHLADTSDGLAGKLGKMGLAVGGVVAAWQLGTTIGEKVRDQYKEMTGKDLPSLTDGLLKLTLGVDGASKAFDHHGVAAKSAIGRQNELKMAVAGTVDELRKVSPELDAWKKKQEAVELASKTFEAELSKLSGKVGFDFTKWVKDNAEWLNLMADRLIKDGTALETLPPRFRAALESAGQYKTVIDEVGKAHENLAKLAGEAAVRIQDAAGKEAKSAEDAWIATRDRVAKEKSALNERSMSYEEFQAEFNALTAEEDAAREKSSAATQAQYSAENQSLSEIDAKYKGVVGSVKEVATAYKDQAEASRQNAEYGQAVATAAQAAAAQTRELGGGMATLKTETNEAAAALRDAAAALREFKAAAKEAAGSGGGGDTIGPIAPPGEGP